MSRTSLPSWAPRGGQRSQPGPRPSGETSKACSDQAHTGHGVPPRQAVPHDLGRGEADRCRECLIRMRVREVLADVAHVDLPALTGVIMIVNPGGDQALPGYLEMR